MFRTALGRHKTKPFLNLEIKSLPLRGKKNGVSSPKIRTRPMSLRNERWGVIVNPYSGKRQLQKDWKNIFYLLKKAEINFSEQLTAFPGHAIEIARTMVESGFRHLLIVGGDGTLNEVVNGIYTSSIADKQAVTLALVPYGTGNDWARYWGITRNYRQLARQLFCRKCTAVDLGKITYTDPRGRNATRYFINGAGWGFDGLVVRITNKIKKIFGGSGWVYSLAVFIALFKLKVHRMCLKSDDKEVQHGILTVAIGNGCYSGGGLKQVPDATPTDGLFHITAMGKLKLRQVPSALKMLFADRLPEHAEAHPFVTSKFTLDYDGIIDVETDGVDLVGRAPFIVEVVPNGIQMLVP